MIPAAGLLKSTGNIPMMMHPPDPIGNSSAGGIRLTFYLLTALLSARTGVNLLAGFKINKL